MEIVKQTSTKLIIQHRPVFLWMFGGIFVLAGLLTSVLFCKLTTLTCQRQLIEPTQAQGTCNLIQTGLLDSTVKKIPLNILQGARVEQSRSDDDYNYRVILLTINGEIPLTSYSSSNQAPKRAIVSQINSFLENSNQMELTVVQDDRWFVIITIIFVIIGISIVAFFAQTLDLNFNKTLGSVTLTKKGLLGTKVLKYRLQEFTKAIRETYSDPDSSKDTDRVVLILASGDRVPLTAYFYSGDRENKQKIIDAINKFINSDR
ncbi:hypothetical protein Ple7327_3911 [Pleurocapsa sp. PCC 7327]|uniref:hypothetical protein n=1 Tax=Pleurocapsa sp. PCC 7327 TaxID=118163 RepID=UPI00029FCE3A|nr:hypothetical protein [Pleurocapsa sp. PCC 7327]AFY79064.1 hypothetical protein Ple7327_3911 [Pleurocapsa sp. PCC 7327]